METRKKHLPERRLSCDDASARPFGSGQIDFVHQPSPHRISDGPGGASPLRQRRPQRENSAASVASVTRDDYLLRWNVLLATSNASVESGPRIT